MLDVASDPDPLCLCLCLLWVFPALSGNPEIHYSASSQLRLAQATNDELTETGNQLSVKLEVETAKTTNQPCQSTRSGKRKQNFSVLTLLTLSTAHQERTLNRALQATGSDSIGTAKATSSFVLKLLVSFSLSSDVYDLDWSIGSLAFLLGLSTDLPT